MNPIRKRKQLFARKRSDVTVVPLDVGHLIEQIHASGKISRKQHLRLMTAILSNDVKSREERSRINQILDATRAGQLRLTD